MARGRRRWSAALLSAACCGAARAPVASNASSAVRIVASTACGRGTALIDGACTTCAGGSIPAEGECWVGTLLAGNGASSWQLDGTCYALVTTALPWRDAEKSCRAANGHLTSVRGFGDNVQISNRVSSQNVNAFWTGLNDRGNLHSYTWADPACCSAYRPWSVSVVRSASGSSTKTREPKPAYTDPSGDIVTYHCVALQAGRLGEDRAYAEDCGGALPYVCQAPVARAATACAPCPTGSYAVPGASYCSACPLGTYAPHAGMAGCTTCGAWTPARMLASTFSPHAHRAGGGSIKCGGSLGRPQRNSYLTIAVLGVPVAVTASVFSYIAFLRLGAFAARKGAPLRGFNSRLRDREWWANVGTTCIAIFGSLATAFACAFLQPVRQHSNYSWPYKGRLSATNERNGCDPGRGERYFWTAFAAFVITALWCLLPLLNVALLVVGAPVRWHTVALRRRLRAVLEAERTRWVDEERARAALTRQPKDFVCTLCRARRAIALNEPCSHQFLCLECAHSFRESNGDVCNACRAPSTLVVLRQHLDPSVRGGAASVRSVHADNSVRGGRKLQALFDGLLGGGAASPDELWRAIAEAKRSRGRADRKFKERACAGCGLVKDLLVDVPCGHANLCADCANAEGSSSSMDGSGRGGSGRGGLERALSFGRAPRPALVVGVPRLRKHTCLRCSRPSTLAVPVKALNCSVCFDSVDASDLAALGACGHQLCTTCSVGYVRSALGDVAEHVRAGGLRCPLHYAGCASTVTLAVISRLVSRPLANLSEQDRSTILPLAPAEFERLERFFDEAALPVDERFYCAFKDCARLFAVEHRDALAKYAGLGADVAERRDSRARLEQVQSIIAAPLRRIRRNQNTRVHPDQPDANADPFPDVDLTDEAKAGEARNVCLEGPEEKALRQLFSSCTPFAHCPYCARPSCVRCKTAAHPAVACADTQDEAKLTFAFVDATSKPCPQCALRVTHSHGHACHHIRPGSGCPNCATHFCYRCLRRGTSGAACGCRLFCQNEFVERFVERYPFPHDSRCGCTFCPLCRPGAPCEQCDGGCVVCRGDVPPGPATLEDVVSWKVKPPEAKPKVYDV